MPKFSYDLAISFAGEDRALAGYIAGALRSKFDIFYDEFERAELWGGDLTESLPERYCDSRYCLVLLSREYMEKVWTVLERQAIIHEFLKRRGKNYLLPVRVRGFEGAVPGLPGVIGYVTVKSRREWGSVVDLLRAKLR
jgi:hypothetical protein